MLRNPLSAATLVGAITLALGVASCKSQQPTPTGVASATSTTLAPPASPSAKPVNALPVASASVMAAVNPSGLPAYTGPTGVVEGTVYVSGDPAPPQMGKSFDGCPQAANVYGKQFREGPPLPDGRRPLADAMVGVTGYSGYFIPETKSSQKITIDACAYSQRTVVVTYGQVLEIQNMTTDIYAPEFENDPAPALMMAAPKSDAVKLYPSQLGRYRVIERTKHPWMEADVFVIGHPLHAVSDVSGHFRIEGVPVGKFTAAAIHPFIMTSDAGAQEVRVDVDVQSGVVAKVEITLPYAKVAARPPSIDRKPILP